MKIGVVVPCFNRYRKTERFINLLSKQTYKDFHLYLVDSDSDDCTHLLPLSKIVPCTLVQATKDDWWSACNNLGIKQAIKDGCEAILTINDDSIIMPAYLESLVITFQKHNLKVLANRIDFADQPGKIWGLGLHIVWGNPYQFFMPSFKNVWEDQLPSEIRNKEIIPSYDVFGDGVLIHKSVFEQVGFYNERYTPQSYSDVEFSRRCWQHKIPVYIATKVVLYNDIYNLSEDNYDLPKGDKRLVNLEDNILAANINIRQKLKNVFFDIKSNQYWKPQVYMILKYAPRGYKLLSLAMIFLMRTMNFVKSSIPLFSKMFPFRIRFIQFTIKHMAKLFISLFNRAKKLLNYLPNRYEKFGHI